MVAGYADPVISRYLNSAFWVSKPPGEGIAFPDGHGQFSIGAVISHCLAGK